MVFINIMLDSIEIFQESEILPSCPIFDKTKLLLYRIWAVITGNIEIGGFKPFMRNSSIISILCEDIILFSYDIFFYLFISEGFILESV